jgi:hypothetical protein
MQAMLDDVAPKLKVGVCMLSETVRADAREGDIGVQLFRDRAARAEGWLQTIYKEIEEKLIAPRSASITEQRSLP